MHNLELLIDEVRDIINKLEGSPVALENHATKMQLCSCLDVIKDTELCLEAFFTKNIDGLDVGNKYMYVYGTLQALYIQQDSVENFMRAIGNNYPCNPLLEDIKTIRDASVGHPTKHTSGSPGRKFNFITRDSIGNQGFKLGITYADANTPRCYKKVNIRDLIEKQRNIFAPMLLDVINTIGGEEI